MSSIKNKFFYFFIRRKLQTLVILYNPTKSKNPHLFWHESKGRRKRIFSQINLGDLCQSEGLVPEFCAQLTAPKENQQYFISAYLPTYHFAEQFLRLKHFQLAAFYQSGFSFLCLLFNTTCPCKKFFAYIVFKAYRHGQSLPATHGLSLDRALSKYSKRCINPGVRVS